MIDTLKLFPIFFLGACILSASPTSTAAAGSTEIVEETTEEIHNRATEALLRGRLYEALRGFNRVLSLEPNNAAAYYNRGYVRFIGREYALALEDFGAALKNRPGFAAASMNRGVVYSNMGRLNDALTDLNKAAEWNPSNADIFFNRAIVHVKRGAMTDALADYDKMVQLDGSDPNQASIRARLKALLSGVNESTVEGSERNRRIVAEFVHARAVELVLAFAERTCIEIGDDRQALSVLAQADGWKSATREELTGSSNSTVEVTAGWTVINRLGRIAVIQSRSVRDPSVVSCSITAKLGDPHWFEDFATLFTSKFNAPRLIISELGDRRVSRQVVVRDDRARVDVTLQQTRDSDVLTIGTIHGREATSSPKKP